MKEPTTSQPTVPPSPRVSGNGAIDTATLELLASWRVQDATSDPAEICAAERELADFKRAMNESRTVAGEPALYP
jgi:hypothetical protein